MEPRCISLVGFMATGKTSVGRMLARKTGRPLIDIDETVERSAGRKIRDIFETEGESAFRALEREAIRRAVESPGAVITTGGGAVLDPDNVGRLKSAGWMIALTASAETIYRRARTKSHRPLLAGHADQLAEIRRLLGERAAHYAQADWSLSTDGKSPSRVAAEILSRLGLEASKP